jgi:tetratricopeptide (TPR) repeat protein
MRRKGAALVARLLLAAVVLPCRQSRAADDPPSSAPPVSAASSPREPPLAPEPPPTDASQDDPAASAEKREAAAYEAFNLGGELYDQGRIAEALAAYERAYELSPNYTVLYNIGGASLQLGQWARARRAFELYLKLGAAELPPQRVSETRRTLDELKAKTATLTLSMNVPPGEVKIDSTTVEVLELSGLVLDPGEHVLHVSKPGFRPLERTVHVNDGERVQLVLQLFPVASPDLRRQPEPLAPVVDHGIDARWLTWGITGALAVGWGTTAALAIKARHDRNIIERPGTPSEDIDAARRLHKTLAIVSDILLASTLASAGIAAYITWWSDDSSPPAAAHSATPSRFGTHDAWAIGVSGQF